MLLWAAVKSYGGKLVITDHAIMLCNDKSTLHRKNDSANKVIIFTAT